MRDLRRPSPRLDDSKPDGATEKGAHLDTDGNLGRVGKRSGERGTLGGITGWELAVLSESLRVRFQKETIFGTIRLGLGLDPAGSQTCQTASKFFASAGRNRSRSLVVNNVDPDVA